MIFDLLRLRQMKRIVLSAGKLVCGPDDAVASQRMCSDEQACAINLLETRVAGLRTMLDSYGSALADVGEECDRLRREAIAQRSTIEHHERQIVTLLREAANRTAAADVARVCRRPPAKPPGRLPPPVAGET